ncbi:protein eiger-like isoform X2 [Teleopsis dalmanni]|uniref:protein eiger-like isoform X2 n=1 Tax=Teleopsis dalmanni TaxID=139649 RepID=UPI0018CD5B2E|nr:protein eiger-like isoform X2 [Teleopsis dalmanni]
MTAETLKPFISPQSVDTFPTTLSSSTARYKRSSHLIAIVVGGISLVFAAILLVILIWNTNRLTKLETNVNTLSRVLENLQKRLGLQYLDEINDFEKEYSNALIDDPDEDMETEDGDDVDDDDDDEDENEREKDKLSNADYDDYEDLIKKFNSYDDSDGDDEDIISDDDNLYDDFEKYKDSKKKHQRVSRSIDNVQVLTIHEDENKSDQNKTTTAVETKSLNSDYPSYKTSSRTQEKISDNLKNHSQRKFVAENLDKRRSHLRSHLNRRRKIPVYRTAKSSLMSNSIDSAPAAHFHLTRTVPGRQAAIKVPLYAGDIYIGEPSMSSSYFEVENGVLTVLESGLYYIYAQVCYNNTHDQNGFVIFHGHKPFLQCLNTVPTNIPLKIHTCHTSGLIHLRADETIHIRDFHTDRSVILKDTNNRSYFGLIKVK